MIRIQADCEVPAGTYVLLGTDGECIVEEGVELFVQD
jgi:hypothetical protein